MFPQFVICLSGPVIWKLVWSQKRNYKIARPQSGSWRCNHEYGEQNCTICSAISILLYSLILTSETRHTFTGGLCLVRFTKRDLTMRVAAPELGIIHYLPLWCFNIQCSILKFKHSYLDALENIPKLENIIITEQTWRRIYEVIYTKWASSLRIRSKVVDDWRSSHLWACM